jgi:hypothetical protein
MFEKNAYSNLLKALVKNGYQGTEKDLRSCLHTAEVDTQFWEIHRILVCAQDKQFTPDKYINKQNFEDFNALLSKLIKKYKQRSVHTFHGSATINFHHKKFGVTITIEDNTTQGSGGFYGGMTACILYGFKDNRKEATVHLIDKEPVA